MCRLRAARRTCLITNAESTRTDMGTQTHHAIRAQRTKLNPPLGDNRTTRQTTHDDDGDDVAPFTTGVPNAHYAVEQ